MDPERKATLDLIEASIKHLPTAVRCKHLIFLVKDYIEDADLVYARRLIRGIDPNYFDEHMYRQAGEDSLFRDALAIVIDTFGLGWHILARETRVGPDSPS